MTQCYRTRLKHKRLWGFQDESSPDSTSPQHQSQTSSRVEAPTNESEYGDEPKQSDELENNDSDSTFEDDSDQSATSEEFDSSADDRSQLDNTSDDDMSLQGHEKECDPIRDDVYKYFDILPGDELVIKTFHFTHSLCKQMEMCR